MPLSGGLLVPEGIHQPSSPVLRYWPEKTYNTYKEPYLDHKINLVKILREYMHQKKAPARHVFPESGTKSQRDYEQLKHIVSSDT
jgi:hypothetical protein